VTKIITTTRGETEAWFFPPGGFTKQIAPLLFGGALMAGLLLGQPGGEGLISSNRVSGLVGGNSLGTNSLPLWWAFMYFATLTEVPILQGLIGWRWARGLL
jgi:uncharacterized protein